MVEIIDLVGEMSQYNASRVLAGDHRGASEPVGPGRKLPQSPDTG